MFGLPKNVKSGKSEVNVNQTKNIQFTNLVYRETPINKGDPDKGKPSKLKIL